MQNGQDEGRGCVIAATYVQNDLPLQTLAEVRHYHHQYIVFHSNQADFWTNLELISPFLPSRQYRNAQTYLLKPDWHPSNM